MNQNLKAIQDLLQQNNQLTEQDKEVLLKAITDADKQWNITEFKLERTEKVKKTTAILLEETIEELEQKRKAVETQNRKLEIEASLERVRTQAMGMHKLEQLVDVCKALYTELKTLGFNNIRNAQIAINNDEKGFYLNYEYSDSYSGVIEVFYNSHPNVQALVNEMKKSKDAFFEIEIAGKELDEWRAWRVNSGETPDPLLDNATMLCYYFYSVGAGALGISTFDRITIEELNILKRFRNVFELAYRRYSDIENAEAQAREAQIQAALERIRARAMAMHSSEELKAVANILREQMGLLGQPDLETSVVNLYDEDSGQISTWNAFRKPGLTSGKILTSTSSFSIDSSELTREMMSLVRAGKKEFTLHADGSKLMEFLEVLMKADPVVADYAGKYVSEEVFYHFTTFTNGALLTVSYQPPSEETKSLQHRAASVFDMAYRRYLDLKKAEAQAREAQVEMALEKVRAKVMAMTSSDDLNQTSLVFGEQLRKLGIDWQFSYFWLIEEDKDDNTFWITWPDNKTSTTSYSLAEADESFRDCIIAWKEQVKVHSSHVPVEHVQTWLDTFERIAADAGGVAVKIMRADNFKDGVFYYDAMIKFGSFGILMNRATSDEEQNIQSRFAVEFERAYTRFLDLKKAEAQARESQIQLALERVRARTMAMQKSDELLETSHVLYQQLERLGEPAEQLTIGIINEEKRVFEISATFHGKKFAKTVHSSIDEPFLMNKTYNGWKANKKSHVLEIKGDELQAYNTYRNKLVGEEMFSTHIQPDESWIAHVAYFSKGMLSLSTNKALPVESLQLLERFASVFDLTYTRFLDLQKAEAQAREAQIEAALERVRARALAMQQPEELKDVARVLRIEMGLLGVEELETCSIYIHTDNSEMAECWYAIKNPNDTEKQMVSDHFTLNMNDTWVGRQMLGFYNSDEKQVSIVMTGPNRREWIEYCYKNSPVFTGFYGETIPDRTYHLYKFSHGAIGAAAPGEISEESWRMLSRAASVFSLAYSRFKDLTQARTDLIKLKEEKKRAEDALTELQATQKQLIQAEKMASLGELTAGIAHEIQNPLNFVNNFSDVSNELLEEMKEELATGNAQQAIILAEDVKQNLEKILHHGKRADAIVKGMLQHSRASTGQKEPTDINALADEYLRLAFHGLRAKDKTFNAKFETNLDESIGKINIIPQDIGRVLVNLINNAFYAVNEKKKAPPPPEGGIKNLQTEYEPTVIVKTSRNPPLGGRGAEVVINVIDNGNGIPQKVLDKIFQPFFTTKPTGQGTGLGLSLSYDIITKSHGGELKVETKEGEGSEFIIVIPTS